MWKIALRTLARDKAYALINVAGLAIAVACCLILGVYLRSELTYDQSHENYRRIFRVANQFEINGKRTASRARSAVLGPMLKDENADVQAYVRFLGGGASGTSSRTAPTDTTGATPTSWTRTCSRCSRTRSSMGTRKPRSTRRARSR